MNKCDLLADLEAIRKGTTLFGDPNPKEVRMFEPQQPSFTRKFRNVYYMN